MGMTIIGRTPRLLFSQNLRCIKIIWRASFIGCCSFNRDITLTQLFAVFRIA